MFGGGFGGGQQGEKTGPGIKIKVKVSLEDLYNGKEMEVKYTRNIICPHCRGSGANNPEDVKECPKCRGQGVIIREQQLAPGFVQQF
jgi:DnaJ-related protein SCJ1